MIATPSSFGDASSSDTPSRNNNGNNKSPIRFTPRCFLQAHFGQPSQQQPGCGFSTAHWLALMHVGSGMISRR